MPTYPRALVLVDGENLTLRYQAMLKTGRSPGKHILHNPDAYVWHPKITNLSHWMLLRVSYYTSITGDHDHLDSVGDELSKIGFRYACGDGYLNPHLFKKQKKGQKTKSVDINLVTDLLRHAYNKSIDEVLVVSGDGDYIPAMREAMRQGIHVYGAALSSGLSPAIPREVDEFFDLDSYFFTAHQDES